MIIRATKSLFVAAIGLFATLVAFGNLTDYGSNFEFVRHVLLMDTIFPESSIRYRSVDAPWLHHLGYWIIILMEALVALLCWIGAYRLYRFRRADARTFNRAKGTAITGLALGFLVWQVGFMTIGGEWFGMWMSDQWNGVESAFRFVVVILLVLVFLVMRDTDQDA
ncbi:DUF2165 family protein [Orrella marina]|uniref:Small integral membrane protein n=1 Tax=Orrella marina TaxID=2163011 RepID=A0A2R4XIE6_9BURK|nr:DUF2165 domain-containing protein [Orrella marina]AWB33586.1 hypothetical protein DBV39_07550 [Orrella marina]